MKFSEFLQQIFSEPERPVKNFAERMLARRLTGEVKKLTDHMEEEPVFFDDDDEFFRLLSWEEVEECQEQLNVPFAEYGMIPLIDVMNNDYICYRYQDRETPWCIFNIVDEEVFDESASIMDFVFDDDEDGDEEDDEGDRQGGENGEKIEIIESKISFLDYLQQVLFEPEQPEENFAERMLGRRMTGEFKKLTDRMGRDSLYFTGHSFREFFRILSREEIPIFEKKYNVPISEYGVFPVVDVRNDDFICYRYDEKETPWCCFNAVEKRRYDEWGSILYPVVDTYNRFEKTEVDKMIGKEVKQGLKRVEDNEEYSDVFNRVTDYPWLTRKQQAQLFMCLHTDEQWRRFTDWVNAHTVDGKIQATKKDVLDAAERIGRGEPVS